jgi:hypothetical protein
VRHREISSTRSNAEVQHIFADPSFRSALLDKCVGEAMVGSPEELAALIRSTRDMGKSDPRGQPQGRVNKGPEPYAAAAVLVHRTMSQMGHSRRSKREVGMTALPQKADVVLNAANGSFVP